MTLRLTLLDADPDGYIMPRLVFVPARGWKREYPTDISTYSDGTNGDPSLTSTRFWQEAERALEVLITHVGTQTYGERVFGYHLERGEWFQPADPGYDRSMANRDAFRDWLREKYKNSLILLRAAWWSFPTHAASVELSCQIMLRIVSAICGCGAIRRSLLPTLQERRAREIPAIRRRRPGKCRKTAR